MKKSLLIAAAAIVTLASCSKTESAYVGKQDAISFKAIPAVLTKTGEQAFTGSTLGVYGWETTPTSQLAFANTSFNLTGSVWAPETPIYWEGRTIRFTVYAPYNETGDLTVSDKNITYNNVPAAEDFLYGTTTPEANAGTVPIVLRHAKSKVTFKVNADVADRVTLHSITMKTIATTGNVTISYDNDPDWGSPTTGDLVIYNNEMTGTAIGTTPEVIGDSKYIIPYGNKDKIIITYKKKGDGEIKTEEITLASENWLRGKNYIFNVKFSADEIKFSATLEDWEDVPFDHDATVK